MSSRAPIEAMLAATALERARILAPFVLLAIGAAFVISERVGIELTAPVIAYNAAALVALAGLTYALWTRRLPDRWGHAALVGLWAASAGGTLISEYFSHDANLHAVLLIEICVVAIQLDTALTAGALVLGAGLAAPLMIRDGGRAAPVHVAVLLAASTLSILIHLLMKRSLVRAETHRVAAAATARELADRLVELHAAERDRARLQAQLVESSRSAGRSDVARAVLHNVGNVLNSVNVSALLIADMVAGAKAQRFARVAAMLRGHRDDLPEYVRDDPRGGKLLDYVTQLAAAIEDDHAALVGELGALTRNIDHIKAIVASQQSHVRSGGFVERFDIRELVDDALALTAAACEGQAIEVVRRLDPMAAVHLDRHKALQILINLLANARDAVLTRPSGDRRIVVELRRHTADELAIAIADNGCGIAADELDAIFGLGFTRKANGQGLGLHYSACAARELGGQLTARSAGRGLGASFLLVLPVGPMADGPRGPARAG